MQSPLKAVAFDLDSTLCRYALTVEEVIDRSLSRAGVADEQLASSRDLADDYNNAWWTAEEQLRVPTGELRRRAWIQILKGRGIEDDELATRISVAYGEIRSETGFRLYAGVSSLLAELRKRYRLGILTNGPSDMQWEKLRTLDLPNAVDAIVVAGDLESSSLIRNRFANSSRTSGRRRRTLFSLGTRSSTTWSALTGLACRPSGSTRTATPKASTSRPITSSSTWDACGSSCCDREETIRRRARRPRSLLGVGGRIR